MLEFARRPWAIPVVLFVFALALRLLGIGWGLKNDLHSQSYHPDELLIWSESQRIEPAQGKFTPGAYNYGTLYLTQLRIASDMVGAYAGRPAQGDPDSFWTYVSRCHLAGRIMSAVAGALTALLLFLMFRRWVNDVGASMGALLVAVAPAHVVHSRFQTVDVMATFLLVAGAYFALRLLGYAGRETRDAGPADPDVRLSARTPKTWWSRWLNNMRGTGRRRMRRAGVHDPAGTVPQLTPDHLSLLSRGKVKFFANPLNLAVCAGVCAGLSAGTKYTGGMVILALIAVIVLMRGREAWVTLAAGLGGFAVAFLLSTPGVFLDSAAFWRDFAFEMRHTATGHGLVFVGLPSGFVTHIYNLAVGIGPIMLILGMVGLVAAAFKRQSWVWALLAFGLPYYIVIGRAEVMFLRYTFPLYMVVAAGFAYLMGLCHERRGNLIWVVILGIVGLGGLIFPGGMRSAGLFTFDMMSEDPRDEAARYLKKECEKKPDSAVGLVSDPWFYTPPLYPDSALGPSGGSSGKRDELMSEAEKPRIELLIPYKPEARVLGWDANRLGIAKPDFVVFSSFEYGDRLRLYGRKDLDSETRMLVDQTHEFLQVLPQSYEPVRTFGGFVPDIHDLEYICPVIEVWKRKQP